MEDIPSNLNTVDINPTESFYVELNLHNNKWLITLAYRCFKICSDWTKFYEELNFLKHVFLKNGYPLSFIDKCFKMVINNLVIKRPQVTTVEKKTVILSLSYLRLLSLQTRTKLRKYFKGTLKFCKLQIVFKSQRKLANVGISPLTFRKVKPSKESAIRDHLLSYNNILSFDEFTILTYGHKYILEIKKSLLVNRDRPVLKRILVLLNCFFLTITRTLNVFITPQYCFIMLFDLLVTVIVMKVTTVFEIEVKS